MPRNTPMKPGHATHVLGKTVTPVAAEARSTRDGIHRARLALDFGRLLGDAALAPLSWMFDEIIMKTGFDMISYRGLCFLRERFVLCQHLSGLHCKMHNSWMTCRNRYHSWRCPSQMQFHLGCSGTLGEKASARAQSNYQ